MHSCMLHTHDGRIVAIKYTNFCSWIQRAYRHGGGIHQLLSNAVATNKVMHILVYADEITPENVLAPVTARKVWAIYATIKEFHTHCQNIHARATICVVRSSTVNMLDGHLSQLLKAILHDWFTTHVLHLQGLQLHEPVGQAQPLPHKRFYAKLGLFIMDGGAHKFALSMKGDAGCRFCSRCKNVKMFFSARMASRTKGKMMSHRSWLQWAASPSTKTSIYQQMTRFGLHGPGWAADWMPYHKMDSNYGIQLLELFFQACHLGRQQPPGHRAPNQNYLPWLDACLALPRSVEQLPLQFIGSHGLLVQLAWVVGPLACAKRFPKLQTSLLAAAQKGWKIEEPGRFQALPVNFWPFCLWCLIIWMQSKQVQPATKQVCCASKLWTFWWNSLVPLGRRQSCPTR